MSLAERFWAKVDRRDPNECWPWLGHTQSGYGKFWNPSGTTLAHRVAWELVIGPVPVGLTLDHLCRNRSCCNPAHLEPVTSRENTMRSPIAVAAMHARQTHCKRGHEFTPENTWSYPATLTRSAVRICKTCRALRKETT